ncbi:2-amino-4-hydroxy-6-hydroxymethyldihydropteridine diphosphokinase [Parerythrobacter jejuensis]|uniref:2-amino-4-hydroxy-6- hydroxymethyldihydropteridine diphosphokinase n=1 Tax=Parerythrobacter jejuensis TaxID=795812 RepID=UPI002D804AA7|nr:2-amino-4-hydroxy-6-hydroxymethyldihydropteridine diphosphokinase [Parerythrobacter jejuensis]
MSSTYLVALGSNRRHHRYGPPANVVRAAMEELAVLGTVTARSAIRATPPMGPSRRWFANAAVVIESQLDPEAMLAGLQHVEHEFGRRKWRRWGDRVLDLDLILWSGGSFASKALIIPHAGLPGRDFVLRPAREIAGGWKDPASGLSLAHLAARLTKKKGQPR